MNYEYVEPYKNCRVQWLDTATSLRVEQLKYGKIKGKTGNAAKDKTTIIYNSEIVVDNFPIETQNCIVNKKRSLDWLVVLKDVA